MIRYEIYEPGDGHKYLFVWGYGRDIKDSPEDCKDKIFIASVNGNVAGVKITGAWFEPPVTEHYLDPPQVQQIAEKCETNFDRACAIRKFLELKHSEYIVNENTETTTKDEPGRSDTPVSGRSENSTPTSRTEESSTKESH